MSISLRPFCLSISILCFVSMYFSNCGEFLNLGASDLLSCASSLGLWLWLQQLLVHSLLSLLRLLRMLPSQAKTLTTFPFKTMKPGAAGVIFEITRTSRELITPICAGASRRDKDWCHGSRGGSEAVIRTDVKDLGVVKCERSELEIFFACERSELENFWDFCLQKKKNV